MPSKIEEALPQIRRIVSRMAPEAGLVDDLTQECCVRVIEKEALWDPQKGAFGPWIGALTRRHVLNLLKRRPPVKSGLDQDVESKVSADEISEERIQWVLEQFGTLNDSQRQLLQWRYVEGLKTKDIAERLGVTSQAVSHRCAAAIKVLQKRARREGLLALVLPWRWKISALGSKAALISVGLGLVFWLISPNRSEDSVTPQPIGIAHNQSEPSEIKIKDEFQPEQVIHATREEQTVPETADKPVINLPPITGTVRTELGEPVPDVRVTGKLRGRPIHDGHQVEALTNEQGFFRLPLVWDGSYTVHARIPSHELSREQSEKTLLRPGDQVDYTASSLIELPVVVFLPDGQRAKSATIKVQGPHRTSFDLYREHKEGAGSEASFVNKIYLKPGRYQFEASAQRNSAMKAYQPDVEITAHDHGRLLEFYLKKGFLVKGKAVFPKNWDAFYFLSISLKSLDSQGAPFLANEEHFSHLDHQFQLQVPGRGEYQLTLKRGNLKIWERYPDAPDPLLVKKITVEQGVTRVKLDLATVLAPYLDEAFVEQPQYELIPLSILAPNGQVLEAQRRHRRIDPKVSVQLQTKKGVFYGQGVQRSGKDWLVDPNDVLKNVPSDDWDGAAWSIKALSQRWGEKVMPFDINQRSLELQFENTAILRVHMRGYRGSALSGQIDFAIDHIHNNNHNVSGLNEEGWMECGPFQPGTQRLFGFVHRGHGNSRYVFFDERVELKSGSQELYLDMPEVCSLNITYASDWQSKTIRMRHLERNDLNFKVVFDHPSQVSVKDLPPGPYELSYGKKDQLQIMNFELSGDQVVLFEPTPQN